MGWILDNSQGLYIVAELKFESGSEFKFNQMGVEAKASKSSKKMWVVDFAHGFVVKIMALVNMLAFY